jgi:hypothetical protein
MDSLLGDFEVRVHRSVERALGESWLIGVGGHTHRRASHGQPTIEPLALIIDRSVLRSRGRGMLRGEVEVGDDRRVV